MTNLITPIGGSNNILKDESLYTSCYFSKSTPKNAHEICEIVKYCKENGEKITVHGSLTGVNGAGVPIDSHSMSTEKLTKIEYDFNTQSVWAESGANFNDILTLIAKESGKTREFPVYPTEKSATIGGAISFGSTGLRTYRYGKVIDYVEEIEYCDANGEIQQLKQGDNDFNSFLASEGMLGIITKVKLKTVERLPVNWGIMFFFHDDEEACNFVDSAAKIEAVYALEYMDKASFDLCEEFKSNMSSISLLPHIPNDVLSAIYVEVSGQSDDEIEEIAEELIELCMDVGGDPDTAWAMSGDEIEKLRDLRHAVSECVNMKIAQMNSNDSRIKKLTMDIVWNNKSRKEILSFYRNILKDANVDFIIFGHIGNFSTYVNIIPRSCEEYIKGKEMIKYCVQTAIKYNSKIFSELGVGKLKSTLYYEVAPIEEINLRLKAKKKFDPEEIFNPYNMFGKKK